MILVRVDAVSATSKPENGGLRSEARLACAARARGILCCQDAADVACRVTALSAVPSSRSIMGQAHSECARARACDCGVSRWTKPTLTSSWWATAWPWSYMGTTQHSQSHWMRCSCTASKGQLRGWSRRGALCARKSSRRGVLCKLPPLATEH